MIPLDIYEQRRPDQLAPSLILNIFDKPVHNKTYNKTCVTIKDSD